MLQSDVCFTTKQKNKKSTCLQVQFQKVPSQYPDFHCEKVKDDKIMS